MSNCDTPKEKSHCLFCGKELDSEACLCESCVYWDLAMLILMSNNTDKDI